MKIIHKTLLLSLSLFTQISIPFFQNIDINSVKESTEIDENNILIDNLYKINCTNYLSDLEVFKSTESELKENTTNLMFIAFFCTYKKEAQNPKNNKKLFTMKVEFRPGEYIFKHRQLESDFEHHCRTIFDKSMWKAQMLLCEYLLKSDFFSREENEIYKKYIPGIEKLILKFKILSREPIKISERAKKYCDVKIKCVK
jgi:hypothetical protein